MTRSWTAEVRGFEDYAEVPPIDEESPEADAARALLSWLSPAPFPSVSVHTSGRRPSCLGPMRDDSLPWRGT
jgi:hypothetical protein